MDRLVQTHRPTPPTKRIIALGLIIAGAIVTLLAIFADRLEIGTGEGFGYYQMIVLIVGIVLLLGGSAMAFQHRTSGRSDDSLMP